MNSRSRLVGAPQQLVNLLLVVDAVCCHDPLEVWLEHAGDLNLKLLDAQCSVLCCCFLALLALLDGFRCRLGFFHLQFLFFGHGLPL
jgi:hypothetical protein